MASTYPARKDAAKAAEVLNNMDVRGKKVRIKISENRCRIFIGNIPKDMSREDFMQQLASQVIKWSIELGCRDYLRQ